jgi:hypothetical protein
VNAPVERGYLLIGDISGFTAFIAGNELDHAQAIIRQILERLIASLTPTLQLVEVEGDAVFVFGREQELTRGELVVELVESAYVDFRSLKTDMLRNATCHCRACQSIEVLDLKFVTHFGRFVVQDLAGKSGPVGSSVNLVHRLLKNDVGTRTGWSGYSLVTAPALEAMGLEADGLLQSDHSFEHLGDVRTYANDLEGFYANYVARRHRRLGPEEVHVEIAREIDAPRPIVWDWLNDPAKRTRWMHGSSWQAGARHGGRTGAESQNHCATFNVIEHVLDWRPFDYYTIRMVSGAIRVLATVTLDKTPGGTALKWQTALETPLPRWLARRMTRLLLARRMRVEQGLAEMARLIAAERTAQVSNTNDS